MPPVTLATTKTVERAARKAKIPRRAERRARASTMLLNTSSPFSLSKTKEPSPPKVKAKARATNLRVKVRKREDDRLARELAREEAKENAALPKEKARETVQKQAPPFPTNSVKKGCEYCAECRFSHDPAPIK